MGSTGNVNASYDEFSSTLMVQWLIPDYHYLDEYDNLNSPSFGSTDVLTADTYPYKWHLTVHPNGSRRQFQGFVSMYLYSDNCCIDAGAPSTSVKIKMSISRCYDGMKSSFSQCHDLKTFDSTSGGFGFHRFISRSYLLDPENHFVSSEGVLEVCVKIKHLSVGQANEEQAVANVPAFTLNPLLLPDKKEIDLASFVHLSSDMAAAFEDGGSKFSDVTLLLEERTKEIKASKAILVARSPVFRAMFRNNMMEEEENAVVIEDVTYDVMKALIRYIYSGSIDEDVDDNLNFVIRLFSAADKYEMKHLKRLCESYICANVTLDCVAFAMIAGHLHNSHAIKVTCFHLISREDCKTKEIEDWSEVHKFQTLIDEMVDYWKDQHVQLGKKSN